MCLNGLLEADLLRDMCIRSHQDCLKTMINDENVKIMMEEDEAYVTETYDSESDVMRDISETTPIVVSRCCICGEMYETIELLRNHCLLTHTIELYEEPKKNQCVVCGVEYEKIEQLSSHVSIFTPNIETQSSEITSGTLVEQRQIKYRRNKHKYRGKYKPGLVYKCHVCNKSIRGYASHLKTEHPEEVEEYKCHICTRSYSLMNSLISHMHNVHCDVQKFRCDICDKIFPRNALMIQHKETAHFNMRKFECDMCHMKFARKQHLAVHAKTHIKREDRMKKCKVCGKEFKGQIELNDHIFKHIYSTDDTDFLL